jgi:F-type H+-transporting ATPase subunit b
MTALAFAEGEGNIISPDGSLVFVLILFLLFVFTLNRLLFRPIGRVLDERESLIKGDTNEGRAAARGAEIKLAEYEAAIRAARTEGYRLIEQQRAVALQERETLLEEARQSAAALIESAKADMNKQAAAARAQLEAETRSVAERISRVLLGRAIGGGGD